MDFVFRPRSVTRFLATIVIGLTSAHFFFQIVGLVTGHNNLLGIVGIFSIDGEGNLPAFYAGSAMLLAAVLLWVIATTRKRDGHADHRYWFGLMAIFLFLAFDELFFIHDRLIAPVRTTLHTSGMLYFAWVIPYGIATLLIGGAYFRFVQRLDKRIRGMVIASGMIYIGGALGLELVGAYIYQTQHSFYTLSYILASTMEEGLEMAGVVIFIHALLTYVQILGIRVSRVGASMPERFSGPVLVPSEPKRVQRVASSMH